MIQKSTIMKMIINLRFLLLLFAATFILGGCGVKKMITNFDEVSYEVTPKVLKADGGKMVFTVEGEYPPNYFKKNAIVEMQPVLVYNNGQDRVRLEPMIHVGEKAAGKLQKDEAETVKFDIQGLDEDMSAIPKKKVIENAVSYKSGGRFKCKCSIDYKPEYNESELIMEARVSGKNKVVPQDVESIAITVSSSAPMGTNKVADGVINTGTKIENVENLNDFRWGVDENGMPKNLDDWSRAPKNVLQSNRMMYSNDLTNRLALGELLLAKSGYEKQTIISKEVNIYFVKNRHNLNLNFAENKKNNVSDELVGLAKFIAQGWEIKDIVINGWASPEGEENFNDGLSEKRAQAAQNYLVKEMKKMSKAKDAVVNFKNPKKEVDFKISAHGPDWNGFLIKVEKSNMSDKRAVMNVIKSSGQEKREEEIRNMILIYDDMEENILPPLRRSEIKVNIYEPKKLDEEIARLSTTNPGELDVKELIYSASLTNNLNTQLNIYKSATRVYPYDWRGYNNAAFVELRLGNVKEASSYLAKAKEIDPTNGIVLNNIGVIASLEGNYEKAESYFKKSQDRGVSQNYNLGVLLIPKGEYDKSLALLKGKTCDYNVALAQLLSGDESAAANNLECAPKTGATYYLLAIVGARTNNSVMMYNNLQKAIEKNSAYKETASKDREFIKYFEVDEFKQIVK